jgi:hypothetical protein
MTVSRSSPADARPWHGPPRPSVRRLADLPIWILRPRTPKTLNCILIEGHNGLILINTGTSHAHGDAIREAISGLTDLPVTTIVYPHHPTPSCHGTTAITDHDSAQSGKIVILAAGRRDTVWFRGVAPNLVIDRECILAPSGVTMRLLPVGTGTVGGMNIYLPRHRVAILTDEPCMWQHRIGPDHQPDSGAPFTRAVKWFLRFPVEHLLGSHMLPLSGPEVNLVLTTYLDRAQRRRPTTTTRNGRSQHD